MRPTIYIRIAKNQLFLRNIASQQEARITPTSPFTTVRMLVGEFAPYEDALKQGLAHVSKKSIFNRAPTVIIQALEMNQGGLCEIEKRILQEGAYSAGAKTVIFHEGCDLSDQQVIHLTTLH